MEDDLDGYFELPNEISDKCNEAKGQLIPSKSKERYEKEYQEFCSWKAVNGVKEVSEDVLLAYMLDLVSILSHSFVV